VHGDACAVLKPKLFRNGRRRAPVNESRFNFFALFIIADRTVPLMRSEVYRCLPGAGMNRFRSAICPHSQKRVRNVWAKGELPRIISIWNIPYGLGV
jgi:hypothetical protein